MKAQKWDPVRKQYDNYEVPKGAIMFSNNMEDIIDCAQCGKTMTYGEGYTSKQIHNEMGMAYAVCAECYEIEFQEERENGY